jgi:hypothetical protein
MVRETETSDILEVGKARDPQGVLNNTDMGNISEQLSFCRILLSMYCRSADMSAR